MNINEAIHIQATQLYRWKSVLKPEIALKLEAKCVAMNMTVLTQAEPNPYDVFRGQDLDMYIHNTLMKDV